MMFLKLWAYDLMTPNRFLIKDQNSSRTVYTQRRKFPGNTCVACSISVSKSNTKQQEQISDLTFRWHDDQEPGSALNLFCHNP